jgi:hypothetical protein
MTEIELKVKDFVRQQQIYSVHVDGEEERV